MRRALLVLRTASVLLASLAAAYMFLRIARLAKDIDVSVVASDQVLANVNEAALQLVGVSKTINEATGAEVEQIKATTDEVHKTARATRETIDSLRKAIIAVQQTTLPQIDKLIADADAGVALTNEQIAALAATIAQTDKLIADTDAQVTDPNIKKLLASLAEAGQTASASLTQLLAIATDGRQVADKFRETYLKPVKLWVTLVEKLLGIAPPIVTAVRTP